jgi:LysM repeat protein
MSSNPFNLPTTYLADQQQMRRERVKVTFYAILGTMVVFCLTLLFQGCKHHQIGAEIPAEVSGATQTTETVAPTLHSSEEASPPPAPSTPAVTPKSAAVTSLAVRAVAAEAVPVSAAAPVVSPVPTESGSVYMVKRGDSLFAIAKAHGTTVQAIKAANQLNSDRILVGKSLKIPAARS